MTKCGLFWECQGVLCKVILVVWKYWFKRKSLHSLNWFIKIHSFMAQEQCFPSALPGYFKLKKKKRSLLLCVPAKHVFVFLLLTNIEVFTMFFWEPLLWKLKIGLSWVLKELRWVSGYTANEYGMLHTCSHCTKALCQGCPSPGPQTGGTGLWPVMNQAVQQEVSGGQMREASSVFTAASPLLALLPELRLLSEQWRH